MDNQVDRVVCNEIMCTGFAEYQRTMQLEDGTQAREYKCGECGKVCFEQEMPTEP